MSIFDIDRKHVWHPYASMTEPPPVECAVSASGMKIRLADGQELIDGLSSWWCMSHGHRPPEIVEAVREQAAKMPHVMFAGFTHEPAVRLTEKLMRFLPSGLDRVFYADSGSIAVEVAAKIALEYQHASGRPGRSRLLAFKGGYHGDTTGAMSLSDPDGMHAMFRGILPQHFFAERPEIPFSGEWDDAAFAPIEELLERHSDEIAAVICEPVFQGANAMRFYHPEYLRKLRSLCSKLDILLIFDEIATGFHRVGPRFAMDFAGVVPDVVCLGKHLTGGCITLAAAVATGAVAERIATDSFCGGALIHGPTFMANPIACAAGCASLDLFEARDYAASVRRIESSLRTLLEPCREIPNVREVRVLGAVGALEVDRLPSPDRAHEIVKRTGVWLRPFGRFVYTMPPFIATDDDLERIANAMRLLANG